MLPVYTAKQKEDTGCRAAPGDEEPRRMNQFNQRAIALHHTTPQHPNRTRYTTDMPSAMTSR